MYIRHFDRSKICRFHTDWFLIDVVWRGGTDPYNYEWNWFRLSWLQRYFCAEQQSVRQRCLEGTRVALFSIIMDLNIRLRSKSALNAATNKKKGKVSLCCGMDRLIVCYCMGQSSARVSAGTRQLVSSAINTPPESIKKNWPAHHAGRIEISESSF